MTKDARTRYWHGGAPGLRVGDSLRPAVELRDRPLIYAAAASMPGGDEYPANPRLVYITTDKTLARAFAGKTIGPHGRGGDLYNVRPRQPIEPDPDFAAAGISYTCAAAKIIAVAERGITLTTALKIHANRFTSWGDGGPIYTRDGYALPSQIMRGHGITAEDLRALGRAPDFEEISTFARQLLLRRGRVLS